MSVFRPLYWIITHQGIGSTFVTSAVEYASVVEMAKLENRHLTIHKSLGSWLMFWLKRSMLDGQ